LAWRGLGWAREALAATLAAQWLALPLILYHFGTLSVIAPLANVVILPAVPLAM
jgi:competence protein ComEC